MRYRLRYMVCALSALILASCSFSEEDDCLPKDETGTLIRFSLTMQQSDSRTTRADDNEWDGNDYDQSHGNEFENRIKASSLRVFVYEANGGAYIGEVNNLMYWSLGDNTAAGTAADPVEYTFVGEITDLNLSKSGTYRFMVVANCDLGGNAPTGTETFAIDDVQEADNHYIPMWGVMTTTLQDKQYQDLGQINLLRAAAKVEVTLADDLVTGGYSISDVKINGYANQGLCFPIGWDSAANTAEMKHDDCFNPGTDITAEPKDFAATAAGKTYVIYLPEYDNTSDAATPATITLTASNGTASKTFENAIQFCNYENGAATEGTAHNIVRNHYYRYTISGISLDQTELEVIITINPWNNRDVTYDNTPLT